MDVNTVLKWINNAPRDDLPSIACEAVCLYMEAGGSGADIVAAIDARQDDPSVMDELREWFAQE